MSTSILIADNDPLLKSLPVSSNKMQIENIYKESLEIPANPLAEYAIKHSVEYLGKKTVDLDACLTSLLAKIETAGKAAS